jgi:abortive infection bacteriophage resistance protein
MPAHDKPFKNLDQQIELLAERGMDIGDQESARNFLSSIGYYNFSGYAYPFREIEAVHPHRKVVRSQKYISGISFDHIAKLFEFDRRLAQLISEGLAAFELKLRTAIALSLGERDPLGHLNLSSLHPNLRPSKHLDWLNFYYRDVEKAKSKDFVVHHRDKYEGQMPIWVAIEIMQFGTLAYFYGLIKDQNKVEVAGYFDVPSKELFKNIIESFRRLRNECSHLSRIWNTDHQPSFNNISHHWPSAMAILHLDSCPRTKLYPKLTMLVELSRRTGINQDFAERIQNLLLGFPAIPVVSLEADMGFPENWRELHFWREIC